MKAKVHLPGSDADLVIVDPALTRRVTPAMLRSRADFLLYEGWELTGWPVLVMVRGRVMLEDGEIADPTGHGRYQRRVAERSMGAAT